MLGSSAKEADYVEIEGQADDLSELQDSLDSEIREALSTLNSDPNDQTIYFKVLKQLKGSKKPWECFIANMSELEELGDRIRREYGSGFYIINIVRNGKLFKKIDYPILAPQPQSPVAAAPGGDLASVLKALSESQERQFVQLREALLQGSGRAAAPTDPIEMMKAMGAAMVSIREMMQPANPLGNLKEVIELANLIKGDGGGGGDTNWMDVLKEAIKSPILSGVASQIANAAPPRAPQLAAPVSQGDMLQAASQPQPVQVQTENASDMNFQMQYVKNYLDMLIQRASVPNKSGGLGQDPEFVAELIINDLPENIIREHLLSPTSLDKAAEIHPGVNQYRQWFVAVQKALNEMLGVAGV
jgi:hypothetical protein